MLLVYFMQFIFIRFIFILIDSHNSKGFFIELYQIGYQFSLIYLQIFIYFKILMVP